MVSETVDNQPGKDISSVTNFWAPFPLWPWETYSAVFFSSRYLLQSLSGRVCKHLTCREHFSIYFVSNWLQHELQELHGWFYSHSSSDKAMFDWKEESGDLHSIVQLSPYLLKNPLPSTPWLCCSVFQGEAPGGMGRRMVCFRAQGWRIN